MKTPFLQPGAKEAPVFLTHHGFLGGWGREAEGAERGRGEREFLSKEATNPIISHLDLCLERKMPRINGNLLTLQENIKEIASSVFLNQNSYSLV